MDQTILKSHVEKHEKFKGSDFRCWQQKILFYLTSSHVSYVLANSKPTNSYLVDGENVSTEAQVVDYKKAASQWNHNDPLTRVACSKKFVVGIFLIFKTNNAKPFVKQVKELQIIFHKLKVKGMEPNANMVRESSSKSKFNHKNKGKNGGGSRQNHSKDGKKDYTQQNKYNFKKVYHCWVCGKPGNKAKDCRHEKEYGGGNSKGNFNQANHVESPKEFAGVIESFLTTNVVDGWFDTGATKHIFNSRRMYVSYQKVNEPEQCSWGTELLQRFKEKEKSY
ncbi:DNA polymerase zeta catalytic subunit-like protein [Tanacetum coccineum]